MYNAIVMLLTGMAVLSLLFGVIMLTEAETAIHEIEGLISLVIFAVLASGLLIAKTINNVRENLEKFLAESKNKPQ